MRSTLALLVLAAAAPAFAQPTEPSMTNLVLWLDASSASHTIVDVSPPFATVAQWKTKLAGATNNLTNAKAGQPMYVPGAINGLPALLFDGSNDVLRDTVVGAGSGTSGLVVFVVAAPASNAGNYRCFFSSCAAGANDYNSGVNVDQTQNSSSAFNRLNIESGKRGSNGGDDYMDDDFPFGTWHVIEARAANSGNAAFIDGKPQTNFSPFNPAATISLAQMRVGSRNYGGGEQGFLHGHIAEVLVYNSDIGCLESAQTGTYLAAKYGLPTQYFNPDCFANTNGDCALDSGDFLQFLLDFSAADLNADIDGSGSLDSGDFLEFLLQFSSGC